MIDSVDINELMIQEMVQGHAKWLSNYPFQLFVTLTFAGTRDHRYASGELKKWRTSLWKNEKLQIAYAGILYSSLTSTHIHLLMVGKNRFGKTLLNVDMSLWEREWRHGKASIEPIRTLIGSDMYVQSHISLIAPDSYDILDYGWNWLKRMKHSS